MGEGTLHPPPYLRTHQTPDEVEKAARGALPQLEKALSAGAELRGGCWQPGAGMAFLSHVDHH